MKLVSLIIIVLLTSCTVKPTVKLADGDIMSLGTSFGTSAKYENAEIRYKGMIMKYETLDKDETVVPRSYINAPLIGGAVRQAASASKYITRQLK